MQLFGVTGNLTVKVHENIPHTISNRYQIERRQWWARPAKLPGELSNELSHLMRFASDEIRSAILSECGDIINNDGKISFSDD